ncbi:hypothetical protein Sjap_011507 [Stephania japonica]|uniref:Uncharacterized protein n=1 Tax=Stephania japonica TaxID=461633 RepID=A0AAP0P7G2_9MAGN
MGIMLRQYKKTNIDQKSCWNICNPANLSYDLYEGRVAQGPLKGARVMFKATILNIGYKQRCVVGCNVCVLLDDAKSCHNKDLFVAAYSCHVKDIFGAALSCHKK